MTTVLDAYFGSDHSPAVMPKVHRTEFPRAEEEIRTILDAFLAEVRKRAGEDYPLVDAWRKRWTAGARELVRVLPKGALVEDFMAWAFEQFERSFPDQRPISPKSIMYLADRYKPRTSWKDYATCEECGALSGHSKACSRRAEE